MEYLVVDGLVKNFATQKAVDNVSFLVKQGSIFGMLGPNGAGKTTLIRMITGIFYPDHGTVKLDGQPFNMQRDVHLIGYMPEERGLYKKMKIGEQALYLAQLKGMRKADAMAAIKDWFVRFEMESWWNKKVEDLSKGMSQKLQFVTTVLHKPKLIILDEPFSGLDPVNANLIKDEIYKLAREGATILFSTHRMEQVEEICDSIVLINKGQKILDGSVQQVKQDFKEHLFALQIAEPLSVPSNSLFDIIRQNGNEYVLRQHANASNNDVLNYFISNGAQVQSFHEILPSLNEIFIRLVEGTPMARQFNDRLN